LELKLNTGHTLKWLAPRIMLIVAAFAVSALVAELGLRAWYFIADVPIYRYSGQTSEALELGWLERTRRSGSPMMLSFDRYHPRLGWSLKPNLREHRFKDHPPVTSNAQGWRAGYDFEKTKRENTIRIAAIGDSFTFGEAVSDDETWPAALGAQIQAAEVMNFGIHGYGTDQQLLVLEDYVLDYNPDVVVLGFFVEDITRNGVTFRDYAKPMFVLDNGELVLTNTPIPTPEELLARDPALPPTSYLKHFVEQRLRDRMFGVRMRDVVYEEGLYELTRSILVRMREATAAIGAEFMVVVIPSPNDKWAELEVRLDRWAPQIGYAVVHLRDTLHAARREAGSPKPGTFHFDPAENWAVAERIADGIREHGWLPSPVPGVASPR